MTYFDLYNVKNPLEIVIGIIFRIPPNKLRRHCINRSASPCPQEYHQYPHIS